MCDFESGKQNFYPQTLATYCTVRNFVMCKICKPYIILNTNYFNKHTDNICKKANTALKVIRRNTCYCQLHACKNRCQLYNTLVGQANYAGLLISPVCVSQYLAIATKTGYPISYVMSNVTGSVKTGQLYLHKLHMFRKQHFYCNKSAGHCL